MKLHTSDYDGLNGLLLSFKGQIDYVFLEYTWGPHCLYIDTKNYFVDKKGYKIDLVAMFEADSLDNEYSLMGSYERALEFSKSYGCWDCSEVDLIDNILIGRQCGYNESYEEHPEDSLSGNRFRNIRFMGLVYFEDNKPYLFDSEDNAVLSRVPDKS